MLGWANSIAAGLMLGVAYALSMAGLSGDPFQWTGGAMLGVLFVFWTHRFAGTSELELNRLDDPSPEYGYQVLLAQSLHSSTEGVAIGVAAVVDLRLGVFTAFVLAAHNVAEGTVLCAVLRSRQVGLLQAATLAVATSIGQILLAIVVLAVLTSAPGLLQTTLGFAVGTFVYLVMVELLPEGYRQAGYPSIALLTSLAMGVIAFLEGVIL
jgi:zinc transporter ZupT